MIRTSWAIANVCSITQDFSAKPEITQKLTYFSLNYMVNAKEKIVSNAIRAFGQILERVDIDKFQEEVIEKINAHADTISKINAKVFNDPFYSPTPGEKKIYLETILRIILRNIEHQSPKIVWNSCVAVGNAVTNPSFKKNPQGLGKVIFDKNLAIWPLVQVLVDKPNFKIRIHASQTLLKYETMELYGGSEGYLIAWSGLLSSFENLSSYTSYQDEKYVRKLDHNLIELFLHFTSFLQLTKEHS